MRIENGIVVDVDGGRVLIEANAEATCASCAAKDSCNLDVSSHKRRIWMDNTIGAQNGDLVSFKIEEKGILLSSLILYLLPVVLLMGGAIGLSLAAPVLEYDSELMSVIGGLAGLLLYIVVLKVIYPHIKKRNIFSPVLVSDWDCAKDK